LTGSHEIGQCLEMMLLAKERRMVDGKSVDEGAPFRCLGVLLQVLQVFRRIAHALFARAHIEHPGGQLSLVLSQDNSRASVQKPARARKLFVRERKLLGRKILISRETR